MGKIFSMQTFETFHLEVGGKVKRSEFMTLKYDLNGISWDYFSFQIRYLLGIKPMFSKNGRGLFC